MKFQKKISEVLKKIFRKFYTKFGESLQKICGISKLILRTFESKNLRITKSFIMKSQFNFGNCTSPLPISSNTTENPLIIFALFKSKKPNLGKSYKNGIGQIFIKLFLW